METFVIKALSYGVLGLCAIMLVAVWRVLVNEQNREGDPRRGIIQFATLFMAFSLGLAVVNSYVQLTEGSSGQLAQVSAQVAEYSHRLDLEREKLDEITSLLEDVPPSRIDSEDPVEKTNLKATINKIKSAAKAAQAIDPK